jgi:serine/threonine-protein kinase
MLERPAFGDHSLPDPPNQLRDALADRYRLERELGQGGMATVYLAHDLKHDRDVALKVLRPELAHALGPERFLTEIRLTARLDHPHILTLMDSGEADGCLYYVLPYIRGASLRQRLEKEGQLAIDEAVHITSQVAAALDYAHRHGVIHRDIKPENILLHEGEAIVTDFGIALALHNPREGRLTETGLSLGTPQYMSPEQAAAEKHVDARTDIYSLGAVLFEMLAGEPPYIGATARSMMAKRFTDPIPSARRLRNTVPVPVDLAIQKALATVPADRFGTAMQFADALMSMSAPTPAGRSIAVLPFANLSADPENEYFVDGMTEEVINVLTQLSGLRVAARTSTFAFKGKAINIAAIAAELHADTVLEGSVRKAGNHLRITVRLTSAADGYHLWSQQYDRELRDVFAIQDEIARAISDHLQVTLERQGVLPSRPPAHDLEAYQLYLKGRYFSARRDRESLQKAIECFDEAVKRDSNYGAAYAGLADSYVGASVYGYFPPLELRAGAKAAAERAVALDEWSPEAHFALGYYAHQCGWDLGVAEMEFRRAASLSSSSGRPLTWLGLLLAIIGRTDEAMRALRQAQAIEPLSPLIHAVGGFALLIMRALDQSLEASGRALELEPTFLTAHLVTGLVHSARAKHDEAIAALKTAASLSTVSPLIQGFLGLSYAHARRVDEAREMAAELERREVAALYPALIYWGVGEEERAFDLFATGFEQRVGFGWMLGSIPGNERLGGDRRWIELLRSSGLTAVAAQLERQSAR